MPENTKYKAMTKFTKWVLKESYRTECKIKEALRTRMVIYLRDHLSLMASSLPRSHSILSNSLTVNNRMKLGKTQATLAEAMEYLATKGRNRLSILTTIRATKALINSGTTRRRINNSLITLTNRWIFKRRRTDRINNNWQDKINISRVMLNRQNKINNPAITLSKLFTSTLTKSTFIVKKRTMIDCRLLRRQLQQKHTAFLAVEVRATSGTEGNTTVIFLPHSTTPLIIWVICPLLQGDLAWTIRPSTLLTSRTKAMASSVTKASSSKT